MVHHHHHHHHRFPRSTQRPEVTRHSRLQCESHLQVKTCEELSSYRYHCRHAGVEWRRFWLFNLNDPVRCSHLTQRRRQSAFFFGGGDTWRARGARAYNGGLGAEPPAGSRGRAPGQGVRGEAPWSWKLFSSPTCNGQSKFVPFSVFSAVHYNKIERCKIRAGTPQ